MTDHKVVGREEWLAARNELLEREKELTRRNDELALQRRELPWLAVEKDYSFETEEGTKTLPELFRGRSQLLIYHLMFGPRYEAACTVCSSIADTIDPQVVHLGRSHTEEEVRPFVEGGLPPQVDQMASASGTDAAGFIEESPGLSAFALEDGVVYQTYATTARGLEPVMAYYSLLDRAPMGRHEEGEPEWRRRHDEYEDATTTGRRGVAR
jgi:predicted dithiol-disulfide oxidoreductase (DUF899 family)